MHKHNGDFVDMCGVWVFLPCLSMQALAAFQSCGELHGKRTTSCWWFNQHLPTGTGICFVTKLLLFIVSLDSDLVFLNGGHEQRLPGTWPLTFYRFIHFAVFIHGVCMESFLIMVG